MPEHQPIYPPSAWAAADTTVSRACFDALLARARAVANFNGGAAYVVGVRPDGWTKVKLFGCGYPSIQLPPIRDDEAGHG